jgi:hypothetical protein
MTVIVVVVMGTLDGAESQKIEGGARNQIVRVSVHSNSHLTKKQQTHVQ